MNDSLLYRLLTDYRTYAAAAIGSAGAMLSSRRMLERWPAVSQRFSVERVALVLPFLIFVCAFFLSGIVFDWSGEFAGGILCAFGFVFSLQLLRFRSWWYRGVGLLFALFYAYNIYGTIHAWIARAEHGHPFR